MTLSINKKEIIHNVNKCLNLFNVDKLFMVCDQIPKTSSKMSPKDRIQRMIKEGIRPDKQLRIKVITILDIVKARYDTDVIKPEDINPF